MKIAVVTDDGKTISKHFGRATHYLVFTVEGGQIVQKALLEKVGHGHPAGEVHIGDSAGHGHNHGAMIEPILDCAAMIAGGMGRPAYLSVEQAHIQPVITELDDPERAVLAYLDGTLVNHVERLH